LAVRLAQCQSARNERLAAAAPCLQQQLVRAKHKSLVGETVAGRQRAWHGRTLEQHRICRHA
jgi:hypothetical protein